MQHIGLIVNGIVKKWILKFSFSVTFGWNFRFLLLSACEKWTERENGLFSLRRTFTHYTQISQEINKIFVKYFDYLVKFDYHMRMSIVKQVRMEMSSKTDSKPNIERSPYMTHIFLFYFINSIKLEPYCAVARPKIKTATHVSGLIKISVKFRGANTKKSILKLHETYVCNPIHPSYVELE